jgi:MT-A70
MVKRTKPAAGDGGSRQCIGSGQNHAADKATPDTTQAVLPIDQIIVGDRTRRDLGDIAGLATSISSSSCAAMSRSCTPTWFEAEEGGLHSQKPQEAYALVEKLSPAPRYFELFSRSDPRDRWDMHGDEVGKLAPRERRGGDSNAVEMPEPCSRGGGGSHERSNA